MEPSIGIFDSGVGGLSVLRALRRRMPLTPFIYLADSAHAPYGERGAAWVIERSLSLTQHLLDQGARMVIVACNTATALAIETLRARWPDVPFVGVEPGIKPAAALTRNGRVGVLATSATIASTRLNALVQRYANGLQVTLQPCPGLAAAIERGDLDHEDIGTLLERYCAALREAQVDTVVLGCTHYPFVSHRIAALLPGAQQVDTAHAVAERARSLWTAPDANVTPRLTSTGDAQLLSRLSARWLGLPGTAKQVQV